MNFDWSGVLIWILMFKPPILILKTLKQKKT